MPKYGCFLIFLQIYLATVLVSFFNPHPARSPSATPCPQYGDTKSTHVSILTRPVGRVQRCGVVASPCPSTGFNPHPARRPSATARRFGHPGGLQTVSILTRPVSRVQRRNMSRDRQSVPLVSILTRPVSRVQRRNMSRDRQSVPLVSILTRPVSRVQRRNPCPARSVCFNPHPAREPSATARSDSLCFNPHPAREPGATSIHSISRLACRLFQSSPGP